MIRDGKPLNEVQISLMIFRLLEMRSRGRRLRNDALHCKANPALGPDVGEDMLVRSLEYPYNCNKAPRDRRGGVRTPRLRRLQTHLATVISMVVWKGKQDVPRPGLEHLHETVRSRPWWTRRPTSPWPWSSVSEPEEYRWPTRDECAAVPDP